MQKFAHHMTIILMMIIFIPSSHASLVSDSVNFPMTIWGKLTSNSQNVATGATIEFYNDGTKIGSIPTLIAGQYGSHGALGGDVALPEFTNSVTLKVVISGTSYDVTSAMMNDSSKDAGCPNKDNITYSSGGNCQYDIELGVDLSAVVVAPVNNPTPSNNTSTTSSSSSSASVTSTASATPLSPKKLTSSVSSKLISLKNQGVDLSDSKGAINSPVKIETTTNYVVNIPKATTVKYKDGTTFTAQINYPKTVKKSKRPQAPSGYQTAKVVEVGSSDGKSITFSKPFTLTIPVTFSEEVDSDKVQVHYFDTENNSYKKAGDGGILADDQKSITVEVTHMTMFAVFHSDEFDETPIPLTTKTVVIEEDDADTLAKAASAAPLTDADVLFIDIKDHWAKDYIFDLTKKGIFKNQESYRPNDGLLRAELVKILVEAFNLPKKESVTETKFSDVDTSAWFAVYIEAASTAGVVKGYSNGTFKPAKVVNRAEALKMILGAKGVTEFTGSHNFEDVPSDSWFSDYVAYAVDKKIVKGLSDTRFAPADTVTRAQVAKMIQLTMNL